MVRSLWIIFDRTRIIRQIATCHFCGDHHIGRDLIDGVAPSMRPRAMEVFRRCLASRKQVFINGMIGVSGIVWDMVLSPREDGMFVLFGIERPAPTVTLELDSHDRIVAAPVKSLLGLELDQCVADTAAASLWITLTMARYHRKIVETKLNGQVIAVSPMPRRHLAVICSRALLALA